VAVQDRVQLIAYVDRLAGDLPGLVALLDGPLAGRFGGIHLLPFFDPIDGADAGFDPIDHRRVDARLGTWEDVAAVAARVPVMADLVVNHASSQSAEFLDVLDRGDASPHAALFLTFDAVFPDGARADELAAIHRPRPGLPFTTYPLADGTRRLFWTTFTDRQIDLDLGARAAWTYLTDVLDRLAAHGVSMVRLDAVGYAVKTRGTSCFMTDETLGAIERLRAEANARGLEVLVEVHSHWQDQVELARRVDWVYDFALPPLVLDAFATRDTAALAEWIDRRPHNAVVVLDTHDGIGVVDVAADPRDPSRAGLLDTDRIDALVESIHTNSRGESRAATGAAASNLDRYQVNCTYRDALGANASAHLTARAIQLFLPGVPQLYYVGLLAGHNDLDLLRTTGVGRDINRHRYTPAEVAAALDTTEVRRLLTLVDLRDGHDARGGVFAREDSAAHELVLTWTRDRARTRLVADLAARDLLLTIEGPSGTHTITGVAGLDDIAADAAALAARARTAPAGG
jgi:sucrose phosphorylase